MSVRIHGPIASLGSRYSPIPRRPLSVVLPALVLGLWVSVGALNPSQLSAQRTSDVRVLIKDHFPDQDVLAMVRVDPKPQAAAVIALRASEATPELLAQAIRGLRSVRERRSGRDGIRIDFVLRRSRRESTPTGPEVEFARQILRAALAAPRRRHTGIGEAREYRISIPEVGPASPEKPRAPRTP